MKIKFTLLLAAFFVSIINGYSQAPTVTFTVSSSAICRGLAVNYTNIATNTPTSWTWYFPYGTPATYSTNVSPGNPPPITYNSPGIYYATCVVRNGFGFDSVTVPNIIQVLANPAVTITPPSGGICDVAAGQAFDTVYFSATYSPLYLYSWAPGGSLSCNACPNPQAFPAVTTVYTLTVTGPGGCTTTLTDTVIAGSIKAKITGKDSICLGSADTLIASGGSQSYPGTTYLWSNGKTTSSIFVSPNVATTYSVTIVSGAGGCTSSAAFTVYPFPIPNFTLSYFPADSICYPSSVTIIAAPASTYNYVWNGPFGAVDSNVFTASPAVTTIYTLVVQNKGCYYYSLVKIKVNTPPVVFFTGATQLCQGSTTLICATGGTQYIWSTGGTTSCVDVQPPASQTYTVQIRDGACYKDTTFTIIVDSMPVVSFSGDTSICSGDTAIIYVHGGGAYLWTSGSTADSIIVTETLSGSYNYYVTVTKGACSKDSSEVTVMVSYCAGASNYSDPFNIYFYPNPVRSLLTVKLDKPLNQISKLCITDVTGREILTDIMNPDKSQLNINISSLASAVYFLKIQNNKGIVVKKFMKE